MKSERIEEIEELLAAATEGPWFIRYFDDEYFMNMFLITNKPGPGRHEGLLSECFENEGIEPEDIVAAVLLQEPRIVSGEKFEENAELIAAAPTIIRELLDEVKRLQKEENTPWRHPYGGGR